MKPIRSVALAAAMLVALHATGAAQSAADSAPVISALATVPPPLSPDELVRLHAAVVSLMTQPTSDALATIQEIRRLMLSRLETAGPVRSAPTARN